MQAFLDNLSGLLINSAISLGYYKYLIIVFLALVEGPMISIFSGFLVKLGFLNPFLAYPCLLLGDLIGDFGWYTLGRYGAKKIILKYGKYISLTEDFVARVEAKYKKHQLKIMFISKITMGFGFALATIITAGMIHISPKKFGLANLLGGFIWIGLLMSVGYTLGHAYLSMAEGFRLISLIASAVSISLVLFGFQHYMRNKFLKNGFKN